MQLAYFLLETVLFNQPQSEFYMTNTPVVLMTYNRPLHTRKVLDALRRHKENI
jgi:hypothetical protein